MMQKFSTLLLEIEDNVAHLTLNRPDAANGINLEMARDLDEASLKCDANPDVRVILIKGAGRMFCGGGDLKAFASQSENELPRYLEDVTSHLHRAIARFSRAKSPVIAAVHGSAAGAGFSLACACDLVIAAESAKFTMAYTRAGLTPDGSATYFLPRMVGYRRAAELMFLNPVLSAKEARDLGIVTRVVPDAELDARARALASELAAGPTRAYAGIKKLLIESATSELEEQMGRETETICTAAWSSDAREGIDAFVSKRTPRFIGE
jgi:2-(1,2-epoxy-1,2-dihydrophenyl)acetyl-CoA isomerase